MRWWYNISRQYKICNNQHDFDTNKRSRPSCNVHDIWYWCHVMILDTTLYHLIMLSMFWRVQFQLDPVLYTYDIMISRVDVMPWYRVCDVMPCYRVYWRVQFHDIYKLNSISCDIICRCSSCHAMISSRCHGMISYVMSCHVMISSIHEPRVVLSISNNNVIAYNA